MTREMDMSGKCKLKGISDTDFAFIKRSKEFHLLKNGHRICLVKNLFSWTGTKNHKQTCVLILNESDEER